MLMTCLSYSYVHLSKLFIRDIYIVSREWLAETCGQESFLSLCNSLHVKTWKSADGKPKILFSSFFSERRLDTKVTVSGEPFSFDVRERRVSVSSNENIVFLLRT